MGVIDKVTETVSSLLPSRRDREESRHELPPVGSEVLALRDNLDRWLERFFEEPWGLRGIGDFEVLPSTNVHETDKEIIVSAEVPGMDRENLELTISGGNLVIRGEKVEEKEDERRDVRMSERRYGSFVRTVPLPEHIDLERAEARVNRGVLTVRFPKLGDYREARRIPIGK